MPRARSQDHSPGRRRQPPKVVFPADDEIAELAYEMYLARVSRERTVRDYWHLAETLLLELAAKRIPR